MPVAKEDKNFTTTLESTITILNNLSANPTNGLIAPQGEASTGLAALIRDVNRGNISINGTPLHILGLQHRKQVRTLRLPDNEHELTENICYLLLQAFKLPIYVEQLQSAYRQNLGTAAISPLDAYFSLNSGVLHFINGGLNFYIEESLLRARQKFFFLYLQEEVGSVKRFNVTVRTTMCFRPGRGFVISDFNVSGTDAAIANHIYSLPMTDTAITYTPPMLQTLSGKVLARYLANEIPKHIRWEMYQALPADIFLSLVTPDARYIDTLFALTPEREEGRVRLDHLGFAPRVIALLSTHIVMLNQLSNALYTHWVNPPSGVPSFRDQLYNSMISCVPRFKYKLLQHILKSDFRGLESLIAQQQRLISIINNRFTLLTCSVDFQNLCQRIIRLASINKEQAIELYGALDTMILVSSRLLLSPAAALQRRYFEMLVHKMDQLPFETITKISRLCAPYIFDHNEQTPNMCDHNEQDAGLQSAIILATYPTFYRIAPAYPICYTTLLLVLLSFAIEIAVIRDVRTKITLAI